LVRAHLKARTLARAAETEAKAFRIHHPDSGISGSYTPADIIYNKEDSAYVVPAKGGEDKPGNDPFIRLASSEKDLKDRAVADAPPDSAPGQGANSNASTSGAASASHPRMERCESGETVTEDVVGEVSGAEPCIF
jgi:hypothetical protein